MEGVGLVWGWNGLQDYPGLLQETDKSCTVKINPFCVFGIRPWEEALDPLRRRSSIASIFIFADTFSISLSF